MGAWDLICEAAKSLKVNKSRTVLTSIGIVIGIAAVVSMTSFIQGLQDTLSETMGLDKARLIYIIPDSDNSLDEKGVGALQQGVDNLDGVSIVRVASCRASVKRDSIDSITYGVNSNYFEYQKMEVSEGSFFSEDDNESVRNTAVVGPGILEKLFGDTKSDAVGDSISIDGKVFIIKGVVKCDNSLDQYYDSLFVPEKSAKACLGIGSINHLIGSVSPDGVVSESVKEANKTLSSHYGTDEYDSGFTVVSMESVATLMDVFTNSFKALITLVASVSLIVGGVGIMNMMLTNVSERTKEIGLRVALGAGKHDISRQFLVESIFICVIGGAIGVVSGLLIAVGLSFAVRSSFSMNITASVSVEIVAFAFSICVLIGALFGYYPARIASSKNPAEALRR